ncbi:MAG TPA: hypothetical protein VGQ76_22425 [Thermoanaerobaculia bacterium]|nr:hypothetical protein [Thermoanaerobaculia bacterium]
MIDIEDHSHDLTFFRETDDSESARGTDGEIDRLICKFARHHSIARSLTAHRPHVQPRLARWTIDRRDDEATIAERFGRPAAVMSPGDLRRFLPPGKGTERPRAGRRDFGYAKRWLLVDGGKQQSSWLPTADRQPDEGISISVE